MFRFLLTTRHAAGSTVQAIKLSQYACLKIFRWCILTCFLLLFLFLFRWCILTCFLLLFLFLFRYWLFRHAMLLYSAGYPQGCGRTSQVLRLPQTGFPYPVYLQYILMVSGMKVPPIMLE